MSLNLSEIIWYISIVLMIFVAIIMLQEAITGNEPISSIAISCKEICRSNDLNYFKYTTTGHGGMTHTCYCKDDDGRISTRGM